MTTPNELLELAERCEKADRDSIDLNLAIARALGVSAEPFTDSLDAAMQLVPNDFRWWFSCGRIRATGQPPEMSEAFAKVWRSDQAEHDLWRGDNCATPALALTAAALRAIAEKEG